MDWSQVMCSRRGFQWIESCSFILPAIPLCHLTACRPSPNMNDLVSEYQQYQDATAEEEGEYDEDEDEMY